METTDFDKMFEDLTPSVFAFLKGGIWETSLTKSFLEYCAFAEKKDLIRWAKGFSCKVPKKPTRLDLIILLVKKLNEPIRVR